MTDRPAADYAAITAEVTAVVARHSANDRTRAAYLTARAALLILRADLGPRIAAEKGYALADEMATSGGPS